MLHRQFQHYICKKHLYFNEGIEGCGWGFPFSISHLTSAILADIHAPSVPDIILTFMYAMDFRCVYIEVPLKGHVFINSQRICLFKTTDAA